MSSISATGEKISGALESTDLDNPVRSGSFYDDYELTNITVGELVLLTLFSEEFDTYLQLINADTGEVIDDNDDFGGITLSQLEFIPEADFNYLVRVTSYGDEEIGAYTLRTGAPDVDLSVVELTAPETVVIGDYFDVDWIVRNLGVDDVLNGSWSDGLYLSEDTVLDKTADIFLDSESVVKGGFEGPPEYLNLPSGESYSEDTYIRIDSPEIDTSKNWNLILVTDLDNDQPEQDELNNTFVKPIQIESIDIDLKIDGADFLTQAGQGSASPISWIVTNVGADATNVFGWNDYVYLSTDEVYDTGDVLVAGEFINRSSNPLESNQSYTETDTLSIPFRTEPGDYFLLLRSNPANSPFEFNQDNNLEAIPFRVLGGPDLSVTSAQVPSEVSAGETVDVSWVVKNTGEGNTSESWFDRVYLSDDQVYDNGDRLLRSERRDASLESEQSYTVNSTVAIPDGVIENKYLLFVTDQGDDQQEVSETNNIFATLINSRVPNLIISDASAPEIIYPDERIEASWTVQNIGQGDTTRQWRDQVYLSTDEILDDDDIALSNSISNVSSLNADERYSSSASFTVPDLDAGNYHLIFETDSSLNDQSESDETDNTFALPIEVGERPNLVIDNAAAPTSVSLNESFKVSWEVLNQGLGETKASIWKDDIYLSKDTVLDDLDQTLVSLDIRNRTLAPGDTYTVNWSPSINFVTEVGDYYLLIKANRGGFNQLSETDTTDNLYTLPIQVTAPNLIVSDISAPTLVDPSEEIEVSWTVSNIGDVSAPASWEDHLYLSTDETLGGGDLKLGEFRGQTPLGANDSYTQTRTVKLPNDRESGNYYLLVKTDADTNFRGDSEQGETDETDNVRAIPIGIQAPSPDLQVSEIKLTSEQNRIVGGETVSLTWTVTNDSQSATQASEWTDTVYLSTNRNQEIGPDDYLLDTFTHTGSLDANGSYTETREIQLPEGVTGDFYFVVKTDSDQQVNEQSLETNNIGSTNILTNLYIPVPGTLAFSNATYSVNEDGTPFSEVTIERTEGSDGEVTVTLSLTDGTTSNGDYDAEDIVVTFADGETTKAVTIPVIDDAVYEDTETINLTLSAPTNGADLGEQVTAVLNVLDDDAQPGNLGFSQANYSLNEDGTGAIEIAVVRTDGSDGEVSATVVLSDGTATGGDDYITTPITVNFANGETSKTITVPIVDDAIAELDESINLALTNATGGATLGDQPTAVVTIVASDITPTLTIDIAETAVTEDAGTITGTVSRNTSTTEPLTVTLRSSDTSELVAPQTVTIPVGESSASFNLTVVDDDITDKNQAVTVIATAPDFISDADDVTIINNDLLSLSLALDASNIAESGDNATVIATVTRNTVANEALTVRLQASDTSVVNLPDSVIIPAGATSTKFEVSAVDNAALSGNQAVTLTATPTDVETNAPLPTGTATASLEVLDDESPSLGLSIDRSLLAETGTATTTVTRNGDINAPLTVNLSSSDTGEATVPTSVVIAAGEESATFTVTGVDDATTDGAQSVSITATATGLNANMTALEVTDVNVADLAVTQLAANESALTNQQSQLTYKVDNQGLADLSGTWTDQIYLSEDNTLDANDQLLSEFTLDDASIGAGEEGYSRTVTYTNPRTPGTYYLIADIDADNAISEGTGLGESNNTFVEAFDVEAAYSAEVFTDTEDAVTGQSIVFQGTAHSNVDNSPIPYEFVTIEVENNGFTRELSGFTNGEGVFFQSFTPLAGEGGTYNIRASFPDNPNEDTGYEDSFKILGAQFDTNQASHKVIADQPFTDSVSLANLTDTALTDFTYSVDSLPDDWNVQVTVPSNLSGDSNNTIEYTITAPNESLITQDTFNINLTSAEGVEATLPVNVNLERIVPRLVVDVSQIESGMLRGDQTTVEIELTNEGGAVAEDIQVLLPDAPWLSLATTDTIEVLAPGESTNVSLLLTPGAELDLITYEGNVVFDAAGNDGDLSLPFEFRAVSDAVGNLQVNVVDELFYFAEGAPRLDGATVIVRDYFTQEEVARVVTDETGVVNFDGLAEGYYALEVKADDHDTFKQTVQIGAGESEIVESFLATQTVKYTWTVTETEIEDQYDIAVESDFQTNVPIPTVTVEPQIIDFGDLQAVGQVKQFDMTITNHGLIAANGVELNLGTHPFYKIEPLIDDIGTLSAKSSITVPVRITRINDFDTIGNPAEGSNSNGSGIGVVDEPVPTPPYGNTGSEGGPNPGGGDGNPGGGGGNPGGGDGNPDGGDGNPGGGGGDNPGGGGGDNLPSIPCQIFSTVEFFYDCGEWKIRRSTPIPSQHVEGNCSHRIFDDVFIPDGGPGIGVPIPVFDSNSIATPVPIRVVNCSRPSAGGGDGPFDPDCKDKILGAIEECIEKLIKSYFYNDFDKCIDKLDKCFTGVGYTGWETAYNCFKAGVNCAKAGGKLSLPIWSYLKYAECVYLILTACSDQSGNFTSSELKISDAFQKLSSSESIDDFIYSSMANLQKQYEDFQALATSQNMIFGDSIWWDAAEYDNEGFVFWIEEFEKRIEIEANDDIQISEQERVELLNIPFPDGISGTDVNNLIDYWNRTASYWQSGIFNQNEVPQGQNRHFIAIDIWSDALSRANDAIEEATSEGFTGVTDKATETILDLQEVLESESLSGEGVCAKISIAINQDAVMTRSAFLGELIIENTSDSITLEDISVNIEVRDQNGNIVNDLFGVTDPLLDNLSAVDGSGILGTNATGSAEWTFIPSTNATTSDEPVQYSIGGTLSYEQDGELITVPLLSTPVTVYPQAELYLDYFQQRNVYGDDPFTDETEISEPFSLGVLVQNKGFGAANNLSITSAQPEIVENEKGLLIDFDIIGSQVNDQAVNPSLSVDFGTIEAGETGVADWLLKSSLQGKFIDYEATFEHVNDLGVDELSLIKEVNIHELIRKVQVAHPTDDNRPDFLVNDKFDANFDPDKLYFSDGTTADVTVVDDATVDASVSLSDLDAEITGTATTGWTYIRLQDPANGQFIIDKIVRSDGTEISGINVWRTDRTFPATGRPTYENVLHFLDKDSTGSYTVIYKSDDSDAPAVESLTEVTPSPRNTPVDSLEVTFTEAILPDSFDVTDFTLTRDDGTNLITSAVTINQLTDTIFEIQNLTGLTGTTGQYEFTLDVTGIQDLSGNAGVGTVDETWTITGDQPAVTGITGITDTLITAAVDSLEVTFTEVILPNSFEYNDLTLTLDDGNNLLDDSVTITQVNDTTYRIENLDGFTNVDGDYTLSVDASGIQDADNNAGVGTETIDWSLDSTAPTLTGLEDITTSLRNTPITSLEVTFDQAIDPASFDHADLTLSVDGGPNLITDAVTIEQLDDTTYVIKGLNNIQTANGDYVLTVNSAAISDIAGNTGNNSLTASWTLDTIAPIAATNLQVSATPTEGQLNTNSVELIILNDYGQYRVNSTNVTLTGELPESNLQVYVKDATTNEDLGQATVTGTQFTADVVLSGAGSRTLELELVDLAGNRSTGTVEIFSDVAQPSIVEILNLPGLGNNQSIESLDVVFSEVLNLDTFDHSDIILTRDGGDNLITDAVTVEYISGTTYRINGLTGLTGESGTYRLEIKTDELQDLAGNSGFASEPFIFSLAAPDTPGLSIRRGSGITLTESGANGNYTIALNTQPTSDVQVNLTVGDGITTDSQQLVFTPDTWNTPQTVTITTPDDTLLEGTQTATISHTTTSDDPAYSDLSIADVTVTINDNDAELAGRVWNDANADGTIDANETGLDNWTVYVDANLNGSLDDGEISTTTDAEGNYEFTDLRPGTYTVTQVVQDGWEQTLPAVTTTGASALLYTPSEPEIFTESERAAVASQLTRLDDFRSDSRFADIDGTGFSSVIIDTGIDVDHPFFGPDADADGVSDRIVYQYDFADNDTDASDQNGHGSHIASVLGSEDSTYGGVAPGAELIALKVFKDSGSGRFADLEESLQWVINNADDYNIASVNLSLGDEKNWTTPSGRYGIDDEIAALASMGIIVTAAAGNNFARFGSNLGLAYPATDPNTIAVGAVVSDSDQIADFSQRHPELLDIFAPGVPVIGADANGGTKSLGGTSQAAPYIAGIAVLAQQLAVESLGRKLTVSEFESLLTTTGVIVNDGDDEQDAVANTGLNFSRVDMVALAEAIINFSGTAPTTITGGVNTVNSDSPLYLPGDTLPVAYTVTVTAGERVEELDFGNQDLDPLEEDPKPEEPKDEDTITGQDGDDTLVGTDKDEIINGGLGSDTLTGAEGKDTFTGTLNGLDDDTITDLGDEDQILIIDAIFDKEDLIITPSDNIITLGIDTDGDGTPESTINLEGTFDQGEFIVEADPENPENTIIRFISGIEPETPASLAKVSESGLLSTEAGNVQVKLLNNPGNNPYEVGIYTVDDAQGLINGLAPGEAGYTQAAIQRSQALFSLINNKPSGFTNNISRTLSLEENKHLWFYLIPDNTVDAINAGTTAPEQIIFPNEDTFQITETGPGLFNLSWETAPGTAAFDDIVVSVQPSDTAPPLGTALQGRPNSELLDLRDITGQTLNAEFTLNREAAYDNFIGFYTIADETGGIDTNGDGIADIRPGEAGYTQAALSQSIDIIDLTVANQATARVNQQLLGGSILAPFIVIDDRPETLLDADITNDPDIYFAFLGANSDGADHIRLLGDNTFGFEDLPGGGDQDFNDVIVQAKLSIA